MIPPANKNKKRVPTLATAVHTKIFRGHFQSVNSKKKRVVKVEREDQSLWLCSSSGRLSEELSGVL
jgi:hypothetical protein